MFLRFLALCIIFTFLQACSNELKAPDDLALAKDAMQSREWLYAERLLGRYLTTAENPEKRWEAWQAILIASEYTGANFAALKLYYDTMLHEFLDDEVKKKVILEGLATLLEKNQDYDGAVDMWTMYTDLDVLEPQEIFEATRKSISIYLHTGQFKNAEDALYNCLALDIPVRDSAVCLYELADLKAGRGKLKEATELASQVLEVETYAHIYGQAAFLLGDIEESQERYAEAKSYFEKAKDFYPNAMAVESRIAYLVKLLKK